MFRSLINTVRVFKNAIAKQVLEIEARPGETDFADIQPLVSGARGRDRCIEAGDLDDGIWTIGPVIGLIDDIPTCQELLNRRVSEARKILQSRVSAMFE